MPTHRERRATDTDIEALRQQYVDQLDALGVAGQRVRDALDQSAAALAMVRDHLRDGGSVSDFAGLVQPQPLRTELARALSELERVRHRSQQLVFRLLHAEGRSMSEIARAWGISRQLVSRLINEPL